ncbi:hypothetical protein PoB_004259200 [Plakobranchus ocellatus]|uniref:Mutator-like transposase domain-containing protein n=1 Tax=Plakobranchus ocellatus TaxID=259542 RepID=A0AAV4B9H9_9GAST|nr:hypothetical protein PoB_004259200 [Plakobranchus ocellatus]
MTTNNTLEDIIPVQESASKCKFGMFQDQDLPHAVLLQDWDGTLMPCQLLGALITPLACPLCFQSTLQLRMCTAQNLGFVRKVKVLCSSFELDIVSTSTSPLLADRGYDLNRRAVAASLVTGLGPEGLSKFCEVMNLPTLHHKTTASHVGFICTQLLIFKERVMEKASEKVQEAYEVPEGIVDIDVSYDGSRQTQDHASMSGLECVIEQRTGLVVNYHTMS